jgi:hypothetical protein
MNKNFLIILGIIVGLVIVGLIVFWIFYPGGTTTTSVTTLFGLFPGGGEKTSVQSPPPLGPEAPVTIQLGQQRTLIQLTQKAVVGATFTGEGKVRYFEKATGNIYDIEPQGENAVRISNTLIPGIYEVYWSPDVKQAAICYTEKNESSIEDVVRNFGITSIDASSTSVKGIFLPAEIKTIAVSPKERKIFYIVPYQDVNIGVTASFENKQQKQVFSTPFGEWASTWPAERTIGLLTKPSATVQGYLYKLDAVSGSFQKILGPINGLTSLWSPDGGYIIYSESGYNDLKTYVYSTKDGKTAPFGAVTLPEKCVWSKINKGIIYCAAPSPLPSASYPDDWYQGLVSFTDRLWKINILNGETEVILSENPIDFDVINPFLNKNEDHLFFQNKKDGTLWGLKLF